MGKRVSFINIQNSSTMQAEGYTCLPVRTGAERVLGGRTSSNFNMTAKDDCTVTKVTSKVIKVKDKDGQEHSYRLGRVFGSYSNKKVPHEIVTNLKVGDKLKLGDTICYNKNFFEPDPINKNHTNFKMGLLARVALIEGSDGYEDSSAISTKLAGRLNSKIAHKRDIVVTRDQDISNLVSIGDMVEPDTILCTIHSSQSASNIFDDEAIKSLEALGAFNPKSEYKGVVEKIEARYVPELEAMSETLQEIVNDCDKRLYRERTNVDKPRVSGQVEAGYRVGKNSLTRDNVVISVYITEDLSMGVGDKHVVANQLKSTVGRVWSEEEERVISILDGKSVDLFFSYQSVDNRNVNSPELIGTTSSLLVRLGEMVVEAYFGK